MINYKYKNNLNATIGIKPRAKTCKQYASTTWCRSKSKWSDENWKWANQSFYSLNWSNFLRVKKLSSLDLRYRFWWDCKNLKKDRKTLNPWEWWKGSPSIHSGDSSIQSDFSKRKYQWFSPSISYNLLSRCLNGRNWIALSRSAWKLRPCWSWA